MSDETHYVWHFYIPWGKRKARRGVYYYQGNFFYPLFGMPGPKMGKIFRKIKEFVRDNAELVAGDRAHPDYMNKVELAIDQGI